MKKQKKETELTPRLQKLKKVLEDKEYQTAEDLKIIMNKQISGEFRSGENFEEVNTSDSTEDINIALLAKHRKTLSDVRYALRKINNDDYGICEDCGEDIPDKRLLLVPTATLCVSCKEVAEEDSAKYSFRSESEFAFDGD